MTKKIMTIIISLIMVLTMMPISSFADENANVSTYDSEILLLQSSAYGQKAVKLKWGEIPKATKYVVYGSLYGHKFKKLSTVKKRSFTVKKIKSKKLKAHKVYKFYVAAYSGNKKICRSRSILCITAKENKKYGNVKRIKADADKLNMLRNDTYKISVSKTILHGKKHLPKSMGDDTRYYSSDSTIAEVNGSGVVSAKKAGTVKIYVQDINGKYAVISVTVSINSSEGPDDPSRLGPLCLTAESNRCTISMDALGEEKPADLVYSTDGRNWQSFIIDSTEILLRHIKDRIYIKAADTNGAVNGMFVLNGRIAAGGNVMSLLDSTYKSMVIGEDCALHHLFSGCKTLTKAPALPATTLSEMCYQGMFSGCTNLCDMPELPAVKLATACYQSMFMDCGLVQGVQLPATELAEACYAYMFSGCDCVAFNGYDILPATELEKSCYMGMFRACDDIDNGPTVLPGKNLAQNCYKYMYMQCKTIESAPKITADSIGASSCEAMFKECPMLINAEKIHLCGTTGLDMKKQSCKEMFYGCSGLKNGPELKIGNAAASCCESMYENCSELESVEPFAGTTTADNCYSKMFKGCSKLKKSPELPALLLTPGCYAEMFCQCNALKEAGTVEAIELASGCCEKMFCQCVELTAAPELKAETLQPYCYAEMFKGCAKLNTIKVRFKGKENKKYLYTKDWIEGAPRGGTIYCPNDIFPEYIPDGWIQADIDIQ